MSGSGRTRNMAQDPSMSGHALGHRRELIGIKRAEIGGELLCEGLQAHDKQHMSIVMAKGNNEA